MSRYSHWYVGSRVRNALDPAGKVLVPFPRVGTTHIWSVPGTRREKRTAIRQLAAIAEAAGRILWGCHNSCLAKDGCTSPNSPWIQG